MVEDSDLEPVDPVRGRRPLLGSAKHPASWRRHRDEPAAQRIDDKRDGALRRSAMLLVHMRLGVPAAKAEQGAW